MGFPTMHSRLAVQVVWPSLRHFTLFCVCALWLPSVMCQKYIIAVSLCAPPKQYQQPCDAYFARLIQTVNYEILVVFFGLTYLDSFVPFFTICVWLLCLAYKPVFYSILRKIYIDDQSSWIEKFWNCFWSADLVLLT